MVTSNTSDLNIVGTATQQNGDFLTFDGLIANKFSLIIPSLPNVSFFLQKFSMPSINVNEVAVHTRITDYNEIGEKLNFEPFNVTFIVDKYARNWSECYNWMRAMSADGSTVGKTDDIVLKLDNKDFIRFIGAWPTALTGIDMDSTIDSVQYVKATITLNYDYLDYIGDFKTVDSSYT